MCLFLAYLLVLEDYCRIWQLQVAFSKCQVMHVGLQRVSITYHLGNTVFPSVGIVRDLGVLIDYKLKFSEHCAKMVAAAYRRMYLLFKCLCNTRDILAKAFCVYVRLLLETNCVVWSPH